MVVWGDIHGQYYDMLNILDKTGLPTPGRKLVFNGDFVDRGSFSCEVVILLFAMKVVYPDFVFMNRGNHETSNMNRVYGFMGEAKAKYGDTSCDLFREVFNWLPLAHVIGKKVFVTHGGLFQKDDITLEELEKIDRNREPSDPSPMAEMLWSDPQPFSGRSPSKRGIGLSFGPDVTDNFLKKNNLDLIIRSHEVKVPFITHFPSLIISIAIIRKNIVIVIIIMIMVTIMILNIIIDPFLSSLRDTKSPMAESASLSSPRPIIVMRSETKQLSSPSRKT